MRKPVVLITGAGGEIGHGLMARLAGPSRSIITLDVAPLDAALAPLVTREFTGSITDADLLDRLLAEFEVDLDLPSRGAALDAGGVHADHRAPRERRRHAQPARVRAARRANRTAAPSSSSIPRRSPRTACRASRRRRAPGASAKTTTSTRRRCTGATSCIASSSARYYARHYKQLAADAASRRVDFRCVRFPGLISAVTVPSGGTSDYAPEMIHAAARGEPYACFVRPDTTIPFMAMPDAIDALLTLAPAPARALTRTAYNVGAFSRSAAEIRDVVLKAFPEAAITFAVDAKRQAIVDSWPADVDDSAARADWGFTRLRLRACLQRLPHPDDPSATRESAGCLVRLGPPADTITTEQIQ